MRILSAEMQLKANSSKVTYERETEKLTYLDYNGRTTLSRDGEQASELNLSEKAQELMEKQKQTRDEQVKKANEEALARAAKEQMKNSRSNKADKLTKIDKETLANNKQELLLRFLEEALSQLQGKKVRLKRFNFNLPTEADVKFPSQAMKQAQQAAPAAEQKADQRVTIENNWQLNYSYEKTTFQEDKMSFNANGVVRTADGKEINLQIELNMSRTFFEKIEINTSLSGSTKMDVIQMIDPLVINYAGAAADLTEEKISFDLDADGQADQISFLQKGSGFLALDKNGDGEINDGSELFGTQSGDGFKDLAKYDQDFNGWIDEGDEIFHKLRIWTKDDKGQDKLLALGEVGIGAIYLGNVDTLMGLYGSNNNQNGQIAKTGLFLRENGSAGTVQHVDLSI